MLLPMAAGSGTICKPMITITSRMLAHAALALASLNLLAQEQLNKRLWVLQGPAVVVEYDPATFAPRQTQKIPPEIFKSPQDLQMNRKGQMLFLPATVHESDGFVHENTEREFWFWDGASGRFMERPIIKTTTPSAANKKFACRTQAKPTQAHWCRSRRRLPNYPQWKWCEWKIPRSRLLEFRVQRSWGGSMIRRFCWSRMISLWRSISSAAPAGYPGSK